MGVVISVKRIMDASVGKLLDRYQQYKLSQVVDYDKFNHYAITHHSTRIEGSTLTDTETQLLLDEGLTPKGKPLEHSLMAKDHYQALLFVLQEAKAKQEPSVRLIQRINARVMHRTGGVYNTVLGEVDSSQGVFRKGNVTAGGTYFPNYDKVPKLIEQLVGELRDSLAQKTVVAAQLELSFAAHFNLVSIHPFYDGNGRSSRLLMNFIQAYYGLPLAIVFSEDRADYFGALQQARQQKDIDVFHRFMYDQYKNYLSNEISKYEAMLDNRSSSGPTFSLLF